MGSDKAMFAKTYPWCGQRFCFQLWLIRPNLMQCQYTSGHKTQQIYCQLWLSKALSSQWEPLPKVQLKLHVQVINHSLFLPICVFDSLGIPAWLFQTLAYDCDTWLAQYLAFWFDQGVRVHDKTIVQLLIPWNPVRQFSNRLCHGVFITNDVVSFII